MPTNRETILAELHQAQADFDSRAAKSKKKESWQAQTLRRLDELAKRIDVQHKELMEALAESHLHLTHKLDRVHTTRVEAHVHVPRKRFWFF